MGVKKKIYEKILKTYRKELDEVIIEVKYLDARKKALIQLVDKIAADLAELEDETE